MDKKAVEFNGGAGQFAVAFIVSLITAYIPIFGWPISMNIMVEYIVNNTLLNGRKITYKASYGETLVFLLVNMLLVFVTLGIYTFWFYPKAYKFVADHISYVSDSPSEPVAPAAGDTTAPAPQPAAPEIPTNTAPAPSAPEAPQPPAAV